jgi:hypothetical protein
VYDHAAAQYDGEKTAQRVFVARRPFSDFDLGVHYSGLSGGRWYDELLFVVSFP